MLRLINISEGLVKTLEMMKDIGLGVYHEVILAGSKVANDNATNGDVLRALMPNVEVIYHQDHIELYSEDGISAEVSYEYWNAPYKFNKENNN